MSKFVVAEANIEGDYRYSLTRVWESALSTVTFVLLNPSTADAMQLDPTSRRCVAFAQRERFGGMVIKNLYAYRSTSPAVVRATSAPAGPQNDRALAQITGPVIAGWGTNAEPARVARAVTLLPPLRALSITKAGRQEHPLYVPATSPLGVWPSTAT
ncbi:DUF1643 domain-containing protein [Microbacterium sp. Leaf436]|uniref:DUF1643 domain-containing protein n=1 Tax=Microbacterium sp. Leaf436 TaxID=1736377 RepID=UPI0009E986B8|nr:DUF1643 domain-containing protein [Microbacterium sp. Leaf436]